jgi:hypothetical protein
MVTVDTETIDREMIEFFENASAQLIASVQDAIHHFYASPPTGWEAWESWRTPKPWETRALPNLESYHQELKTALGACDAGDIKPITLIAASYAGLSKDLEFDTTWMKESNQRKVRKAVEQVVLIADKIYRIGYEALTITGRA